MNRTYYYDPNQKSKQEITSPQQMGLREIENVHVLKDNPNKSICDTKAEKKSCNQ